MRHLFSLRALRNIALLSVFEDYFVVLRVVLFKVFSGDKGVEYDGIFV